MKTKAPKSVEILIDHDDFNTDSLLCTLENNRNKAIPEQLIQVKIIQYLSDWVIEKEAEAKKVQESLSTLYQKIRKHKAAIGIVMSQAKTVLYCPLKIVTNDELLEIRWPEELELQSDPVNLIVEKSKVINMQGHEKEKI